MWYANCKCMWIMYIYIFCIYINMITCIYNMYITVSVSILASCSVIM